MPPAPKSRLGFQGVAGSTLQVVLAKREASLVLSPRVRISGSAPSLRYRLMPALLDLSEDLFSFPSRWDVPLPQPSFDNRSANATYCNIEYVPQFSNQFHSAFHLRLTPTSKQLVLLTLLSSAMSTPSPSALFSTTSSTAPTLPVLILITTPS